MTIAAAALVPSLALAGTHVSGTSWTDDGYGVLFVVELGNNNWVPTDASTARVYVTYSWADKYHQFGDSGDNVFLGEYTLSPGDRLPIGAFSVSNEAWRRVIHGSWRVVWYADGRRDSGSGSF